MFGYLIRSILYGLIAIGFKEWPLVQISLYVVISVVFLVLIFSKKPAKRGISNVELIIYELIILVTLSISLTLVVNDHKGYSNLGNEGLGTNIIAGFLVLYVFEIVFMVINLIHAIKTRCGATEEEAKIAPKFVWPTTNQTLQIHTENLETESERAKRLKNPKIEMPTVCIPKLGSTLDHLHERKMSSSFSAYPSRRTRDSISSLDLKKTRTETETGIRDLRKQIF